MNTSQKSIIVYSEKNKRFDENGNIIVNVAYYSEKNGRPTLQKIDNNDDYDTAIALFDKVMEAFDENPEIDDVTDIVSAYMSGGEKTMENQLKTIINDRSFGDISELFVNSKEDFDFIWVKLLINMKQTNAFDDNNRPTVPDMISRADQLRKILESISTRQLISNRESSFRYHLRLISIGNHVVINKLASELSAVYPEICEFAWCGILTNLSYIVNVRTKAQMTSIIRVFERSGGKCCEISEDLYFHAYDVYYNDSSHFFKDMTQEVIYVNDKLRGYYVHNVLIWSCEHITETAREIAVICPAWDESTLRMILRDMLPFTIRCEHRSQALKVIKAIEKNCGKAELHI